MRNLRYGHRGADVATLQQRLSTRGFNTGADGIFGRHTEAALKEFQSAAGLVVDGIAGRKTHAALMQESTERYLQEADLGAAADMLGVDVASIKAVHKVESAGSGFLPDGRVKILFERHIFYRELHKKHGKAVADHWAKEAPHICNRTPGGYLGNAAEYPRYARAATIDTECAQKSASWGLYQIMGFNHAAAGFATVAEMAAAMNSGERVHLLAFAAFIQADKTLHSYLKARDWPKFARRYNGPDYQKNAYDLKLAAAYRQFAVQ